MLITEFDKVMKDGFSVVVDTIDKGVDSGGNPLDSLRCFTCGKGSWRNADNMVCVNNHTMNLQDYLINFSSMRNGIAGEFIKSGYSFTVENGSVTVKDKVGNIYFIIASSQEVLDGANDTKFVTSLKLKQKIDDVLSALTTANDIKYITSKQLTNAINGIPKSGMFDYKDTVNPTILTNPSSIGATYLNKTSGEIFVCTDITAGKNIWNGTNGSLIRPQTGARSITFSSANNAMVLKITFKDANGNLVNPLLVPYVITLINSTPWNGSYVVENGLNPLKPFVEGQNINDGKYLALTGNGTVTSFKIDFTNFFAFSSIEIISGVNFYSSHNYNMNIAHNCKIDGIDNNYISGASFANPLKIVM
ncbi:MAG: hypothetical protein NTZ60_02190 [Campylobacterales bacterium]|nr:hypothetical protein [Campylobacterales bacterium]